MMHRARLCAFPGPVFSTAGFVRIDFQRLLKRISIGPYSDSVRSFGKSIDSLDSLFLSLAPGRHASLTKYQSQDSAEIGLQAVAKCFYEEELALVSEFIGVPAEYIERYSNPPIRWVSSRPSTEHVQHWLKHVGEAYPYAGGET